MTQTPTLTLAQSFALILGLLRHVIAAHAPRAGHIAPLLVRLYSRLARITARFTTLATKPPAPARARARPNTTTPPTTPRTRILTRPRPRPYPRKAAWVLRLVPGSAAPRSQLEHFLAQPDMARLRATHPAIDRLLTPLCRMLGIILTTPNPPAPPPPSPTPTPSIPSTPPPQNKAAPSPLPTTPISLR